MGGPKALLRVDGIPLPTRTCAALARPGIGRIVLVLGAAAERVQVEVVPTLPHEVEIEVVVNRRWREGMLTSVWCGLDAAERVAADALLLHPVDNPFVSAATVDAVLAALGAGATVAVPSCRGRRGHPAGFLRATWPALRAASLARGARSVLADHPDWVVPTPAGPDCLIDLDRPEA